MQLKLLGFRKKTKGLPKIFSFKPTQPRVASLRKIYDSKNVIDSVIIIYFPGPKTVTGEDVMDFTFMEVPILKKIYEALNKIRGVRGWPWRVYKKSISERNFRSYSAEGLNDLINSETEIQFKLSMSQYEGVLSKKINSWRVEIVHLLSKLEALIDFSDEELPKKFKKILILGR